jgi:hypothetical protein
MQVLSPSPYTGATVAMGTRHGKEHQVAPAFAEVLGARVIAPPDLDTDRFGAFTGETPRTLTPREAARAKARLAMEVTGLPLGVASEASYGYLPGLGWTGHEELLLFVDDERGIEVLDGHRTLDVPGTALRTSGDDDRLDRWLTGLGWPEQAVVVRPAVGGHHLPVRKGLTDLDLLTKAVADAAAASADGRALLEPDLRAHHNPTRRAVLTGLATSLAHRLATTCPACDCPGWGRTGVEKGVPCGACGTPTDVTRADVLGCPRCPQRQVEPRAETVTDPRWCGVCNP